MLGNLFKKGILGIAMGSTILNVMLLVAKIGGFEGFFSIVAQDYIRQSLCAMFVGIVFSVLSITYEYEQLSFYMQALIHMGGGLIIYFIVGWYANWLPITSGVAVVMSTVLGMIIAAALIWCGFYLYYRYEAQKINKKIKQNKM